MSLTIYAVSMEKAPIGGRRKSSTGFPSETARAASLRWSFGRIARFFNQLMRGKLTCGPLTIQQFHTLEALAGGPVPMGDLADQVGLHQSTMTRIVDRLERDGYLVRKRSDREKRLVEVALTGEGMKLYRMLDRECLAVTSQLLDALPEDRREVCVETIDMLARTIGPDSERFREILRRCCAAKQGGAKR